MSSEFDEEARNRHESLKRAMETGPNPALVLALVEAPSRHRPESIDGWTVVHLTKTPRHAGVLLQRDMEGFAVYRDYICERTDGLWRLRGGSGGSARPSFSRDRATRPDPPLGLLGVTTLFGGLRNETTLRVAGGRASTEVGHLVIQGDGTTFDIVPDESGWFHVILEGSEAATITAVGPDGEPVVDSDGLPVTVRLESFS